MPDVADGKVMMAAFEDLSRAPFRKKKLVSEVFTKKAFVKSLSCLNFKVALAAIRNFNEISCGGKKIGQNSTV